MAQDQKPRVVNHAGQMLLTLRGWPSDRVVAVSFSRLRRPNSVQQQSDRWLERSRAVGRRLMASSCDITCQATSDRFRLLALSAAQAHHAAPESVPAACDKIHVTWSLPMSFDRQCFQELHEVCEVSLNSCNTQTQSDCCVQHSTQPESSGLSLLMPEVFEKLPLSE